MRLDHDTFVGLTWMVGLVALVALVVVLTSGGVEVSNTGHAIMFSDDPDGLKPSEHNQDYGPDDESEEEEPSVDEGSDDSGEELEAGESLDEGETQEGEGFVFKARPKWIDQEPVIVVSSKELIEN